MKRYRHALTKAIYTADSEGVVRVELGDRVGYFSCQGRWLRGSLLDADPHMCAWVGGPGHNEPVSKPYKSV